MNVELKRKVRVSLARCVLLVELESELVACEMDT